MNLGFVCSTLKFTTQKVVMYEKYVVTHDMVFSMGREYDHEEAETLLILHCHDIAKRDPFLEFVLFSPVIHHFAELTPFYIFLN